MSVVVLKSFLLPLGFVFFGLGFVGVFLPGLPTTPFMLLALWAFARSSRRFHDWLYHHKVFGPPLKQWDQHHIISIKAKIIAGSTMTLSYGYLLFFKEATPLLLIVTGAVMGYGLWFILSKPSKANNEDSSQQIMPDRAQQDSAGNA